MKLSMQPTGRLIKGHVLDVSVRPFVEAMRFTLSDPFLYVKWNPEKARGWGCWEIRRAPEFNSAIDIAEFDGKLIFKVGPREYDLVHHVLDCAFLNYDAIRKLKEIDTWQHGNAKQYLDKQERMTDTRLERQVQQRQKETAYAAKHYKAEIKAFQSALRDGVNPHAIAAHWDHVKPVD